MQLIPIYLRLIVPIALLCLTGCGIKRSVIPPHQQATALPLASPVHANNNYLEQSNKTHIVIFIHGATTFIPSFAAFRYAWQQTSKQQSKESFYEHYQNKIRFGSYRKRQAIGKKGLWRIKNRLSARRSHTKAALLIAHLYHKVSQQIHSAKQYFFYTFGWDGALCVKKRRLWGFILAKKINNLYKKLHTFFPGHTLEISLLGHSHGGNVALHCGEFLSKLKTPLSIDRIFLLGTPIQEETKNNSLSPAFKKIINVYSTGDWIQKIDCISSSTVFPGRSLHHAHKKKEPNRSTAIYDVELKVDAYKPTHAEFWFLGGIIHFFYRLNFPLYPLPLAILMPYIDAITEQCSGKIHKPLITIHPQSRTCLFFSLFDRKRKKQLRKLFRADMPLNSWPPLKNLPIP